MWSGSLTRGDVPSGDLAGGDVPSGEVLPTDLPKREVSTAMEMAAIYSQSPLWHQMLAARERLHHATAPRGSQESPSMTHLPGLPGLSKLPGLLGLPGLPKLHGLPGFPFMPSLPSSLRSAPTSEDQNSASMAHLPGAPTVLEHLKQEMLRGYLGNLAQSTLQGNTSGGGESPHPPSTQNLLSTSETKNKLEIDLSTHAQKNTPSSLNFIGANSLPPSLAGTSMNPFLVGNQTHQPQPNPAKYRSQSNIGPRRKNNPTGKEKVFTCNVCNRSFGYKHVLQNHERTHTGEKPFECKVCNKRFTRDHHLKTHMRLHTGEKPYSCSHCDRQFVQVANLRRHLRVHTGERPYKCDLCSNDFSDSNQLKAHLLIHTGEKPFNCAKCFGVFRRRHHLTQHSCPMDDRNLNYKSNSFINEKEEQYLRNSGPGFSHTDRKQSLDDDRINDTSSSPKSRDTGSGGSPSSGDTQDTGEKRRSRKQKPRRVFQWTEEGGSDETHRDLSPGVPEQTEPEDLTVFRNNQESIRDRLAREHVLIQDYQRGRIISQYSMEAYKIKGEESTELEYENKDLVKKVIDTFDNFKKEEKVEKEDEDNRSEEGFASVSDPQSSHSTSRGSQHMDEDEAGKRRDLDKDEDDKRGDSDDEGRRGDIDYDEDDKRGVSPPTSNIPFYNPYSSHPAAIQLGLAGTAMPLTGLGNLANPNLEVTSTDGEEDLEEKQTSQE